MLVRKEGIKWCNLFVQSNHATATTYVHQLLVHLPEQIARFGLDPWYLQMQSLEHKHKIRKTDMVHTSGHVTSGGEFTRDAKGGIVKSGPHKEKSNLHGQQGARYGVSVSWPVTVALARGPPGNAQLL